MAFWSARKRAAAFHDTLHAPLDGSGAWDTEPEPEPRDWKKIVLIAGLAALSWVATYVGMLELIQSNMGSLPLLHKVIIGFSVAMLMTMIVWLLDQIFSPIDTFTKLAYVAGYIFLTLISVGFGFGFYWKVLESRAEASRSATSAVGQVQSSLHGASTRLEQLQATLFQLSTISHKKAELERTKGTSCPNSSPGDGPRRKMRDEDAARFSFASDFVKGRVGAINTEMAALDAQLTKIVSDDPSIVDPKTGTRNAFMRTLGRRLDMTVTGFNAFRTDPQLRQIRTDLADRAERTTFSDGKGGAITCPDTQLQVALRGVVRAIDQLPSLEKPEIAAVEGSEATIEAFRRLTASFYGLLSFKLPPSADELRALQQRAVQSIENPAALRALNEEAAGLSKRDYIPLGTAIFVDLCLLLVSIGRPMNRFVATRQRMIEAERGPVFPILSRFSEIHNQEELRATFDVFREVIFESGGTYYVAVPLNAPREHPKREELRRDAQTLANLCYALEGQGVLTRPWKLAPTLVAQRKLRRQGSKFIECYRHQHVAPIPRAWRRLKALFVFDHGQEEPAFRIYAFKSGAWPEMILGAVMGAASRFEATRRQQPKTVSPPEETPMAPPPKPRARVSGMELPGLKEQETTSGDAGLRAVFKHRPGAPTPEENDATQRPSARANFHQRFGSYANHAQAELATYRDLYEDDAAPVDEPANSNTTPSEASKSAEVPEDIVVPFPTARSVPAGRSTQALAERLSSALAAVEEQMPVKSSDTPSVDVALTRETATFRLPVSQASLPAGLAALMQTASRSDETGTEQSPVELTLPASETGQTSPPNAEEAEEKHDVEDGAAFEPPLILRRIAE